MQAYTSFLLSGTPDEMTETLACVGGAIKVLKETKRISMPFPESIFRGIDSLPLDRKGRSALTLYGVEVNRLSRFVRDDAGLAGELLAAGLVPLAYSFFALGDHELFADGRQMWRPLTAGQRDYEAAFHHMFPGLEPELAGLCNPIPNMLCPD